METGRDGLGPHVASPFTSHEASENLPGFNGMTWCHIIQPSATHHSASGSATPEEGGGTVGGGERSAEEKGTQSRQQQWTARHGKSGHLGPAAAVRDAMVTV